VLCRGQLGIVHANTFDQINEGLSWHVESFGKVLLFSNEFDWVLCEQGHVFMSKFDAGQGTLVQNGINVRLENLHHGLNFGTGGHELDGKAH
jgi:hypothetical protein